MMTNTNQSKFDQLKQQAEEGNAQSQFELANLYALGNGIEQSDVLAYVWYKAAADNGFLEAEYFLGECYFNGVGVEKNNNIAVEHYQKALVAGYEQASIKLAEMFFCTGLIVLWEGDANYTEDEAILFLTKSFEYRGSDIFKEIGEVYCSLEFNDSFQKVIEWLESFAYQGYVDAKYWLGEICLKYAGFYMIGYGVNIDNERARSLVIKAASFGNSDAYVYSSIMLFNDAKNNKSVAKIVFERLKFVVEKDLDGCNKAWVHLLLANFYDQGLGVDSNLELAQYYYNLVDIELLMTYRLKPDSIPLKSQLSLEMLDDSLKGFIERKDYDLANETIDKIIDGDNGIQKGARNLAKLAIEKAQILDKKNQELLAKEKELEEIMSMFAHKFRSPLDTIIYNTHHEHQPKLYIQAAQTMRGLLDIFSIISADDIVLIEKLKRDNQGESGLLTVFSKTLDMILLHLLSAQAAEKIQQHYLRYAKKHGLCDAELSYKQWNDDYFELERQLQTEWEQSFAALLSQQATLEQRLAWLEQRFFKLELQGFEQANIQFKEYGITESFLTILLNEILVNAFKYYSSDTQQPVVLAWAESDSYQVLSCRNPSARHERDRFKGSGKGHTFLSALARKTGSQFTKPKPQDDFVLEFGIANQLLISS